MKSNHRRASLGDLACDTHRRTVGASIGSSVGPLVEPLEERRLLSGSPKLAVKAVASPGVQRLLADGQSTPLASAKPGGSLTPALIRAAYGLDQINFDGITGDGAGQTIAIIDAYDDPAIAGDLHAFDAAFGLSDPVLQKVAQDGSQNLPPTVPSSGRDWALEESLDVEWAHGVAPAANILLVEANSSDMGDLGKGAAWAAAQPGVVTVSLSFGSPEYATETADDSYWTTPAGHAGVTFVAASGDAGAPGIYPAYSPNVVAVGGTHLITSSSGAYLSETGWTDGGGGISQYESRPAYQSSIVTPSATQRTIPDLALDADPATGVPVYDSYDYGAATPWTNTGGTSLAAPMFAAMIAIVDQGLSLRGQPSLDGQSQTLPMLYSQSSLSYHDVTAGNNGFAAAAGYDLVTGLGSPVANVLVPSLAGFPVVATAVASAPQPALWIASNAHTTTPVISAKKAKLLALGGDDSGESSLTYTWSVLRTPTGAKKPTFSINGTNPAKQTVVTFYKDGGYEFRCTIRNARGNVVLSNVSITVRQTASTMHVSPSAHTVRMKQTLKVSTSVLDQFGHAMRDAAVVYAVVKGSGSIGASSGLFTASKTEGAVEVLVEDDSLTALVDANVVG